MKKGVSPSKNTNETTIPSHPRRLSRRQFVQTGAAAATAFAMAPRFVLGEAGLAVQDKFEPSWDSLKQYECPQWFRDAKFGIWACMGPQSVPEFTDWYARFMYNPQGEFNGWQASKIPHVYNYHVKKYGHPSVFGYKDVINLFTADKFDPDRLLDLYARAGAEYFVAMANHHDNFDNWNSKYQPWNSVNVGPKKDLIDMWAKATRKRGLRFGVSTHTAPAWSWFEPSRGADVDGPLKGVPYDGNLTKADGKGKWWEGLDPQDLYCRPHDPDEGPDEAYIQKYYNRTIDLIDNYRPDLVYFDGGLPFGKTGLEIAAYYYNANAQWHNGRTEAVINLKGVPEDRRNAVVDDIERGRSAELDKWPWQTDTCIGGWFYVKGIKYKTPKEVILMLADIVSKNGNLLLSIPQRGDGSIDEQELAFLEEMAAWMKVNKEAIFGTRPWTVYGEGPTKIKGGRFADNDNQMIYASQDIRFTTKSNVLYAILLDWPGQQAVVTSLPKTAKLWFRGIRSVKMLGTTQALKWKQDDKGLTVQMPEKKPCEHAYVLKISG